MKFFYLCLALAVVVASVVALEEEDDELFDLVDKRSLDDGDLLEAMLYESEPMVKRGRFKYCKNERGDNCVCDRKFRRNSRRRYVNCVPRNKGTPV